MYFIVFSNLILINFKEIVQMAKKTELHSCSITFPCVLYTNLCKMHFGQILCRRASTKRHVTLRSEQISKDAQDLKGFRSRSAAVARQSRISSSQIDPPPV